MKIRGARSLARKLALMPSEARREISAAIEKGANEVVTLQKAAAPVRTGRLRASIRWDWGGRGLLANLKGDARLSAVIRAGGTATTVQVRAGSGVPFDYAIAQEFGTQNQSAQPYFYPGYRLVKRRIRSRVTRATNKAARKVAAR